MCYNISLLNPAEIVSRYDSLLSVKQTYEAEAAYYRNSFALPNHPVISNIKPFQIREYTWGLIPFWIKTPLEAEQIRMKTMNAREDTIFEKPSYRDAIIQRRCLIPIDGFFEWRYYEGKNYPYYIHMKDHAIFSIAGIWDVWTHPETKEKKYTFSLITCNANELLEKIHNKKKRMPVILQKPFESKYLRNDLTKNEIKKILLPIDSEFLKAYTISNRVTSKTKERNVPKIIEPYNYPELPEI